MENKPAIGFLIKTLSNKIKRVIDNFEFEGEKVTAMQRWVVKFLMEERDERDVFQKDIEKKFNIRRSTATGVLKVMEKNGYITRISIPGDARLKKVVLTEKAERLNHQAFEHLKQFESNLMSGIVEEELEIFYKVLDILNHNVEENCSLKEEFD